MPANIESTARFLMRIKPVAFISMLVLLLPANVHAQPSVDRLSEYCHSITNSKIGERYIVLARPDQISSHPKIVLVFCDENEGLINPVGKDYPNTQKLEGMSITEATELFGLPEPEDDQHVTYELVMLNSLSRSSQQSVRLEVRFVDGVLHAYRVQGELI